MTATVRPETTRDPSALAERLLRSSARQSYDPEVDIDWDAPLVEGAWFMQPERLSLYGTPTWDAMSPEQRVELSRHEIASIASVGLWFEIILMQMMVRELYDQDPRSERTQYALTEVGDETRHSVMFGRAIARCGVPAYGPTPQGPAGVRPAPAGTGRRGHPRGAQPSCGSSRAQPSCGSSTMRKRALPESIRR